MAEPWNLPAAMHTYPAKRHLLNDITYEIEIVAMRRESLAIRCCRHYQREAINKIPHTEDRPEVVSAFGPPVSPQGPLKEDIGRMDRADNTIVT